MYNCLSVVIFHFFWKLQSDVWGNYNFSSMSIQHISSGDFSVNSNNINGWLRNFYESTILAYGLAFLLSHFVWAFSLMFLFSGRGYWQELIESILYAHHNLKIVNRIQPGALSISHGRTTGLVHFLVGGIRETNKFVQARIIVVG